MRKKKIGILIMTITLLSIAFCKPQTAGAATSDAERIAALENQIKALQNQQQQLAEQNLRLFEMMQKLHGLEIKTVGQETNTKATEAAIPAPVASVEPRQEYSKGWLARILDVPNEYKITDIPHPLEVVNFKATKSEYQVYEYLDLVEGAFRVNNPLWIAEGLIVAEEAGNYTFSIYSSGNNKSLKAIYIDDAQINAGSDGTLLGSTPLEAGLHKVELRICGKADGQYPNFTFNLQVKRPSDKQMLPISQVMLLPVSNMEK